AAQSSPAPENPAARFVKNDNFWMQAGEHPYYEAIPGSAKALLGLKAGDDFSFTATFPADFHAEALRGKSGTYKGKILKVNATVPATDETVCERMGVKTIDELRGSLRERLLSQREAAERNRLHNEIDDLFAKKASFAVPESLVRAAASVCGDRVVSAEIQGKVKGQDEVEGYIKDHIDELRSKIDAEAESLVRLNYIGKILAKELDITATERDVEQLAAAEASVYQRRDPSITAEKIMARIRKDGQIGYYQDRIRYSKVVDWIIDNDIKAAAK
ncbi:MAG: hypothetical protein IJP66_07745, partial [Kiritimatiellae bacterium]|nr:hypothetical protein [Kiritimatiellia bacterium]